MVGASISLTLWLAASPPSSDADAPMTPPPPPVASLPDVGAVVIPEPEPPLPEFPTSVPPPTGKFWLMGGVGLGAPAAFHSAVLLLARGFGSCDDPTRGPNSPADQRRCEQVMLRSDIALGVNLGVVVVAAGSILAGAIQDTRFDRWRADERFTPPPDGSGLLGAGAGLFAYAAVYGATFGPYWLYDPLDSTDYAFFGGSLGAFVAAGALFTGFGAARRRAYNRDFRSRFAFTIEPMGPGRFAFGRTPRPRR